MARISRNHDMLSGWIAQGEVEYEVAYPCTLLSLDDAFQLDCEMYTLKMNSSGW